MPASTITPNRLRVRTTPIVTAASRVSSTMLMKASMAASLALAPFQPLRPVLRELRPYARMQGGLGERVRGDRSHEKEKDENEEELQSYEA